MPHLPASAAPLFRGSSDGDRLGYRWGRGATLGWAGDEVCAGGPQGALTDAPEKAQNFPKRQQSSVNISLFLNPKTGCLPTEAKEGVWGGAGQRGGRGLGRKEAGTHSEREVNGFIFWC